MTYRVYKPPSGRSRPSGVANAERRERERFAFSAEAEVIEEKTGTRLCGRTSDLGEQGCYVDAVNPYPLGTSVHVRIHKGKKQLEAQGRVLYSHPGLGMGIAFTEITREQRSVLEEWMLALNSDLGTGSGHIPHTPSAGPTSKESAALSKLILMLIEKGILTEAEGLSILREPMA